MYVLVEMIPAYMVIVRKSTTPHSLSTSASVLQATLETIVTRVSFQMNRSILDIIGIIVKFKIRLNGD